MVDNKSTPSFLFLLSMSHNLISERNNSVVAGGCFFGDWVFDKDWEAQEDKEHFVEGEDYSQSRLI